MVLLSFWSGMRVGEIAAIKIKDEIRLKPEQTKGDKGITLMIGSRLSQDLAVYVATIPIKNLNAPLFFS